MGLTAPTKILAGMYLVHYANRSIISTLRNPISRSQMHLIVPFSAVVFNLLNGYLMGSWLGGRTSPLTAIYGAVPEAALGKPIFWLGIAMWVAGFIGNIISDEILYNLRKPSKDGSVKPQYSIPHGFLYDRPFGGISFPAYFCEWVEWLGFAIATCSHSPAPAFPKLHVSALNATALGQAAKMFGESSLNFYLLKPSTYACPPFLFFYAEIGTMLPRALRGQEWYQQKFKEDFPKERKTIIPGVL